MLGTLGSTAVDAAQNKPALSSFDVDRGGLSRVQAVTMRQLPDPAQIDRQLGDLVRAQQAKTGAISVLLREIDELAEQADDLLDKRNKLLAVSW